MSPLSAAKLVRLLLTIVAGEHLPFDRDATGETSLSNRDLAMMAALRGVPVNDLLTAAARL